MLDFTRYEFHECFPSDISRLKPMDSAGLERALCLSDSRTPLIPSEALVRIPGGLSPKHAREGHKAESMLGREHSRAPQLVQNNQTIEATTWQALGAMFALQSSFRVTALYHILAKSQKWGGGDS